MCTKCFSPIIQQLSATRYHGTKSKNKETLAVQDGEETKNNRGFEPTRVELKFNQNRIENRKIQNSNLEIKYNSKFKIQWHIRNTACQPQSLYLTRSTLIIGAGGLIFFVVCPTLARPSGVQLH